MLRANTRNRTGKSFTLIELLLIVSILAILTSLLLPGLSSARSTAKRLSCMSSLRQTGMANFQYASDNKNFNVPATYNNYFGVGLNKSWYLFLAEVLNYKYIIYPSQNLPRPIKPASFASRWTQVSNSVFMCPAGYLGGNGESFFYQALSYGITTGSIGGAVTNVGLRFSQVKRPSMRCFNADMGTYNFFIPGAGQDPATVAAIGTHVYVASGPTAGDKNQNFDFFFGRHRNTVNVFYYDGHAMSYPSLLVNRHHRSLGIPLDENMFQITR